MGARALLDINLIWFVWLYRSPIPVRRRGYFTRSNYFNLPSRRLLGGGGGGQHPVVLGLSYLCMGDNRNTVILCALCSHHQNSVSTL
jgi:hypothetical protein